MTKSLFKVNPHINGHDSPYLEVPNVSKVAAMVPSLLLSCSEILRTGWGDLRTLELRQGGGPGVKDVLFLREESLLLCVMVSRLRPFPIFTA